MSEFGILVDRFGRGGGEENAKRQLQQLHAVARNYDSIRLRELLENGSDPNIKDESGRLPIHVLLKDGFFGHLNEDRMQECLSALIEYNCDINARDGSGETPLSLAVKNKFQPAALLLVNKGAETTVRTPKFNGQHSLASKIATTLPEVMIAILDSGVILDSSNNEDKAVVKLDWSRIIQYSTDDESKVYKSSRHFQRETSFLYSLLDAPLETRNRFLKHPLVEAFLFLRIMKTARRLYVFQLLMMFFPICYMVFVYFLYFDICKFDDPDQSNSTTTTPKPIGRSQSCEITIPITVTAYLLSAVVLGCGLIEIYMLLRVDWKYMKSWRAWVLRASIVAMGCTLWPGLQFNTLYNISWQYPIAALGTFLAWIMFLLQMELVPRVKIYLEMMATITMSVIKIILLFLPLLIGFYMGFNMLFFEIKGIMNFILMTVDVGSDEYEEMIDSAKSPQKWFTFMADVFGVTFIIVIAIVFMNFLLGASITDIQELKKNAKIMNTSHRVQNTFVINLIFSYVFNIVSKDDVDKKNWYFTYIPNDEKYSKLFPDKIRTKIALLLKSKYSISATSRTLPNEKLDSRILLTRDFTFDE